MNVIETPAMPGDFSAEPLGFHDGKGNTEYQGHMIQKSGNYVGILSLNELELHCGFLCDASDLAMPGVECECVDENKVPTVKVTFDSERSRDEWLETVKWKNHSGVLFAVGMKQQGD